MAKRNDNNLTDKWQVFADAILCSEKPNATQAYLTAYPNVTVKTAGVNGEKLLKKTEIQNYLGKAKRERSQRTKIDADYVLNRLVEIDEMDVADILDNEGNALPINQWPMCWRRTISGLDLQELMAGDIQTVVRKIKWPDKVKNLELIGKHVDVQAFKEQKQISGALAVSNEWHIHPTSPVSSDGE